MLRRPEDQIKFCNELNDLIADQSEWSQRTFGTDLERGPMGALKHLEKEAKEAQEAIDSYGLIDELADCFLLQLDACRRAGISIESLVNASIAKMEINKIREWPMPTSDEPVEHVRS